MHARSARPTPRLALLVLRVVAVVLAVGFSPRAQASASIAASSGSSARAEVAQWSGGERAFLARGADAIDDQPVSQAFPGFAALLSPALPRVARAVESGRVASADAKHALARVACALPFARGPPLPA